MNLRFLLFCCLTLVPSAVRAQGLSSKAYIPSPAEKTNIVTRYGRLPLQFEPNLGQLDKQVHFMARTGAGTLFLTDAEAVLALPMQDDKPRISTKVSDLISLSDRQSRASAKFSMLRMKLLGARKPIQVTGLQKLPGTVNYFLGNKARNWHTNIPTYKRTKFAGVYKGVDMVYYGTQDGRLEYDFVVKPGADPKQIKLAFTGAAGAKLSAQGDLALKTEAGEILWHKPVTYQVVGGKRIPISCAYRLENHKGNSSIKFAVARYDKEKPLIIDPSLQYSTYLGELNPTCIAVDAAGNACIAGFYNAANFPSSSRAPQPIFGGEDYSIFVSKLNPRGTAVLYTTFLGGSKTDLGLSIALDQNSNAYITGLTFSADWPTTAGAYQTTLAGNNDAFVTKLSTNGDALIYSTLIGNTGYEFGSGIAVDSVGNAYITGSTSSSNFSTTTGAFQRVYGGSFSDAYVAKLSANGATLIFSTYIGGAGDDRSAGIAIDSSGNSYITGYTYSVNFPTTVNAFQKIYGGGTQDAFVTKLNADGSALIYSTYLGGSGNDYSYSIAVDSQSNVFITGLSEFGGFPTTAGSLQPFYNAGENEGFVTKLSPDGSTLIYSTYLASFDTQVRSIAIDKNGNAYVTGITTDINFPTTAGAFQPFYTGIQDVFLSKLSKDGSRLIYSTYLGGSQSQAGSGAALDSTGNVYLTGTTTSPGFPVTAGSYKSIFSGYSSSFAAKFNFDLNLAASHIDTNSSAQMIGLNAALKARLTGGDGKPLSGKYLSFIVNGDSVGLVRTDNNGYALLFYLVPPDLGSGDKKIFVSFPGDDKYASANQSFLLTVLPIPDAIGLGPASAKAGRIMYSGARLVTYAGGSIAGRDLDFSIDGTKIATLTTDATGSARLYYTLPQDIKAGSHNLAASFAGDTIYKAVSKTVTLTVPLSNTSISAYNQSGVPGQVRNLQCRLLNEIGHAVTNRTVSYKINGITLGTVVTDSRGFGNMAYTVPDNLGAGPQTITASFAGDADYIASSGTAVLTILKSDCRIYNESRTATAGTNLILPVRLYGTSNNSIVGRTVSLTVNGVAAGTAVTQTNGVCSFTYLIPSGTSPGVYTMRVSFAGDTSYNASAYDSALTVK